MPIKGAPSSFPTNDDAVGIQQYINFSDKLANKAKEYRESRGFARTAYLSVHLRRGSDWVWIVFGKLIINF